MEEDVAAELAAVGGCEWHIVWSCVMVRGVCVVWMWLAEGDGMIECCRQRLMRNGYLNCEDVAMYLLDRMMWRLNKY